MSSNNNNNSLGYFKLKDPAIFLVWFWWFFFFFKKWAFLLHALFLTISKHPEAFISPFWYWHTAVPEFTCLCMYSQVTMWPYILFYAQSFSIETCQRAVQMPTQLSKELTSRHGSGGSDFRSATYCMTLNEILKVSESEVSSDGSVWSK